MMLLQSACAKTSMRPSATAKVRISIENADFLLKTLIEKITVLNCTSMNFY